MRASIVIAVLSIAILASIGIGFLFSLPVAHPTCEIYHSHYAGFNSPSNIRHIISRDCQ